MAEPSPPAGDAEQEPAVPIWKRLGAWPAVAGGGVALEAVVLAVLGLVPDPTDYLLFFFTTHAVACLVFGLGARGMLPARLQGSPRRALLLLAALPLFIPAAGMIGVAAALLPALYRAGAEEDLPWRATDYPDLPGAPYRVSAQPIYIAVGLAGVLRHSPDQDLRLKAVMASRQMPDRLAIPLLELALKDQVDDVRLLAYSMLDGKERMVFDRIKRLDRKLADTAEGRHAERAFLRLRLAQEYWELAYLGIAHGKVLQHVLEQAAEHLAAALEVRPADAGAHLLMGRIQLRRGEIGAAGVELLRATGAGLPGDIVFPYLAEAAYQLRDFASVRKYLGRLSPSARSRSPLSEMSSWWLG